jgi:hypothetical protein
MFFGIQGVDVRAGKSSLSPLHQPAISGRLKLSLERNSLG